MPLQPNKPQLHELRRIRAVAAYQFGKGAEKAFPTSLLIVRSPNTHRIRHVYNDGKLLATYRPKDGLLALTVNGGLALKQVFKAPKLRVKVTPGVESFIRKGGNVFAKHVIGVDPELRPEEEVLVVDKKDRLLAVGRSFFNAIEMESFKIGIAVKVAEIDFAMMRRGKVNPREANRMMQRMGMQVQQLDDVTKVIMETPTKRIVIDNPEVATVTVQGQTIYQVGGGTIREEGIGGGSDEDAKLVASQAGVSVEQATNALRQSNGDLAQAIILLKQKRNP